MEDLQNNKVILDLDTYNELRDFHENLKEGFTYKYATDSWTGDTLTYITTEEAVEEIDEQMQKVLEENKQLEKQNNTLRSEYKNLYSNRLLDLNWFELIKWQSHLKKQRNDKEKD